VSRHFPALRGVAIILVVINHSITLGLQFARNQGIFVPSWQKYLLIPIKEVGIFAVPLFLFLAASYFVYAAQGKSLKEMFGLIPKNFLYIAVPYLVWSLVFYLVVFLIFGESNSVIGYAKSLLVGYPNNFIPLLIFFTFFAPILIWLSRRLPLLIFGFFIAYQALLVVLLRPDLFGNLLPAWTAVLAPPIIRLPLALWGVFYPLGIIYGLYSDKIKKFLSPKNSAIIFLISLSMFALSASTQLGFANFPLIEIITPLFGLVWLISLKREHIPFVRFFERIGKRSYGLYLTNLIILNILLFLILRSGLRQFMAFQPLIVLLIASATVLIPLIGMEWVEKNRGRSTYRLLFG